MNDDIKTGWLAPDGTLFPNLMWGHITAACKILGEEDAIADRRLLDSRYVRISNSVSNTREYAITWKHWLTPNQKYFLKDYFENPEILVCSSSREKWEEENKL